MEFRYIKEHTHMNAECLKVLIDEYVVNRSYLTIYFGDVNNGCVVDQLSVDRITTEEINNTEYIIIATDEFVTYAFPMKDFSLLDFNDDGYLVLHVDDNFELDDYKRKTEDD